MPISKVAIIKKNYMGTIRIFQVLTFVILAAAGTWGYFQYVKLAAAQEAIAKSETEMTGLQASVDDFALQYKDLSTKSTEDTAAITNKVLEVYPQDENYTALTRILDQYAGDANTNLEPFFASSLAFSQPIINANTEYAVLPFTMSLTASRKNFDDFLRYIETSGDLDTRIRLMDIKTISLEIPEPEVEIAGAEATETGPETLNVSFALNSYFRKPVGATPNAQ
jgi:hypothetical protein